MEVTVIPGSESGCALVCLSGDVTEETSFAEVLRVEAPVLVLDLSQVRRINSAGVREWVNFVAELGRQGRLLVFESCSVAVVQQLNMVVDFRGGAQVRSILLPYYCGTCDAERLQLLDVSGASPTLATVLPCATCGESMEFDDLPESYLSFLR